MGVSSLFPTIRESFYHDNLTFSNSQKFSPAKDFRYTVLTGYISSNSSLVKLCRAGGPLDSWSSWFPCSGNPLHSWERRRKRCTILAQHPHTHTRTKFHNTKNTVKRRITHTINFFLRVQNFCTHCLQNIYGMLWAQYTFHNKFIHFVRHFHRW